MLLRVTVFTRPPSELKLFIWKVSEENFVILQGLSQIPLKCKVYPLVSQLYIYTHAVVILDEALARLELGNSSLRWLALDCAALDVPVVRAIFV